MNLNAMARLMRLDKPIGIWLVLFPALWGVLMAHKGAPDMGVLLMMLAGAVVMRSAGCIINDLTDRDLDGAVERTRHRPLITGEVTKNQAYQLLAVLLGIALILAAMLPRMVFLLGALALPLIVAYPWMKRITWWPQLFLGVVFNFGALIGWAATGASLSGGAFFLYAACMAWTLGYDTIYAMQDAADDAVIGIRSTARRFAGHIPTFVACCYSAMVVALLLAGTLASMGLMCLLGIIGVGLHLRWQGKALQKDNAISRAGALFISNQWLGVWLFFCLLMDRCYFSS
ncbi:MAG: 4-hydroxybenzoate polyprenyltransferase [Rhodospirillales bacterium 12-54-5]|nr:MAG: 4-hydroxybenzoate polyprenyltransferase [Rhodospirillales bacterium 12-54-5]